MHELRTATKLLLEQLKNSRDREIVALRFGLTPEGRQTLENIGSRYNITRERVRQVEKGAVTKLRQSSAPALGAADSTLRSALTDLGGVASLETIAKRFGAKNASDDAHIVFMATLAPSVHVIEDNDHFHAALTSLAHVSKEALHSATNELTSFLKKHGEPATMKHIAQNITSDLPTKAVEQIAAISKKLAQLEDHWGLSHWPQVNPKSIRDKTYLVLAKETKPLHFTDIAERIAELGQRKRQVTVQAVHNELIKDPRFVLVGRGIYALSEWGYTPGTVADIIADVLRKESPLHKDTIVKRVLERRQVKTTTIILNLQEKNNFVRVAKATYALAPAPAAKTVAKTAAAS